MEEALTLFDDEDDEADDLCSKLSSDVKRKLAEKIVKKHKGGVIKTGVK